MSVVKKVQLLILVSACILFFGCTKQNEKIVNNYIPLSLEKGAVIYNNTAGDVVHNFINDGYVVIDEKREIVEYNKSGTILYSESGKAFIDYKGNIIQIDEKQIFKENISPSGKYLMYITEETNYQLKILNLETQEYEVLELSSIISGDLVDWYNENAIVFYGVSDEKENGIFTYNLNTKVQEQIYSIKEGYVSYLESISSGIIIKEDNFSNDSTVKLIKRDGSVDDLSNNVVEVLDIEETNKGIFLLGRKKDDNMSIYEYRDDFKKILFNFPSYINIERMLSSTNEGDLLFIGSNSNPQEEAVYKYSESSISTITDNRGKYEFIKVR